MVSRIIISYGSKDLEKTRRLQKDLKGAGLEPCIDDINFYAKDSAELIASEESSC